MCPAPAVRRPRSLARGQRTLDYFVACTPPSVRPSSPPLRPSPPRVPVDRSIPQLPLKPAAQGSRRLLAEGGPDALKRRSRSPTPPPPPPSKRRCRRSRRDLTLEEGLEPGGSPAAAPDETPEESGSDGCEGSQAGPADVAAALGPLLDDAGLVNPFGEKVLLRADARRGLQCTVDGRRTPVDAVQFCSGNGVLVVGLPRVWSRRSVMLPLGAVADDAVQRFGQAYPGTAAPPVPVEHPRAVATARKFLGAFPKGQKTPLRVLRLSMPQHLDEVRAVERLGFPPHERWSAQEMLHAFTADGLVGFGLFIPGGGMLCAWACGRVDGDTGYIQTVQRHPALGGYGLAEAVLAALLAELRSLGATHVLLHCRMLNFSAIRLYEKLGFRPVGPGTAEFEAPRDTALEFRMDYGPEQPARGRRPSYDSR